METTVAGRMIPARLRAPGCPRGLRSHPLNLIRLAPAKGGGTIDTRIVTPPQAGFARRRLTARVGSQTKRRGSTGEPWVPPVLTGEGRRDDRYAYRHAAAGG